MAKDDITSIEDVYKKLLAQGFCVTLKDKSIKLKIDNCEIKADKYRIELSNSKGYNTHSHPDSDSDIYNDVYEEIRYYIDNIDYFKKKTIYQDYVFWGIICILISIFIGIISEFLN